MVDAAGTWSMGVVIIDRREQPDDPLKKSKWPPISADFTF